MNHIITIILKGVILAMMKSSVWKKGKIERRKRKILEIEICYSDDLEFFHDSFYNYSELVRDLNNPSHSMTWHSNLVVCCLTP